MSGPLALNISTMFPAGLISELPSNRLGGGRPYRPCVPPWASEDAFYNAFKRECDRLGIKDRTFHDLRRTAVVRLAIAGCTEPEIASITGHSINDVKSILERHYLYLDPQIAINAMRKLENSSQYGHRSAR
jgi:integrase